MIKPNISYEIIQSNKPDLDYDYYVTFRTTNACDLKCNYCHWHSGKHYEFDSIIKCVDSLLTFFVKQKFKKVLFYYHGGEPTRHNKIVDILKYVKTKGDELGIEIYNELQTNLTIKKDKLLQILEYVDLLDISFHFKDNKIL